MSKPKINTKGRPVVNREGKPLVNPPKPGPKMGKE